MPSQQQDTTRLHHVVTDTYTHVSKVMKVLTCNNEISEI